MGVCPYQFLDTKPPRSSAWSNSYKYQSETLFFLPKIKSSKWKWRRFLYHSNLQLTLSLSTTEARVMASLCDSRNRPRESISLVKVKARWARSHHIILSGWLWLISHRFWFKSQSFCDFVVFWFRLSFGNEGLMAMKTKTKKKGRGFGAVCYAAPLARLNLQWISVVSSA